ncbi:unnamed protein product [Mucor circinelloides]|uniref:MARVEL domain-containing protein n=1 Tax=Mucor circinelloides f. circinelloides (strain 1006PhL) TaxID=1220926 RepID=S2K2U6_MUCC1|nr:hypothetical protein HMPREF1544_03662 [Mucor circinelloides 1006PhL]KAG1112602.1 hypothetical protein G6F42_014691 [Rhizopus arrhizus]
MGQYKCCCCIPVRAGVLIIALLSAALYIASTVGLFMSKPTSGITYDNVEIDMRVVNGIYYTSIAVSIVFALASLFGVLGSVTQHRKMIAIFKVAYWFVTILQFIVTIAAIIILAVKRTDIVNSCVALYPEETVDTCSVGYRNFMIIFSVVSIVINFIQFYFATAISAYATRLRRTNMHEKLRNLEDFPEPPSKTEFF